ncbi:MAG: hypothetical protein KKD77_21600 [Gammaproteobacteria bacterium]|nr:hypothetical protein [Gammaproteobacteria bacterium]
MANCKDCGFWEQFPDTEWGHCDLFKFSEGGDFVEMEAEWDNDDAAECLTEVTLNTNEKFGCILWKEVIA